MTRLFGCSIWEVLVLGLSFSQSWRPEVLTVPSLGVQHICSWLSARIFVQLVGLHIVYGVYVTSDVLSHVAIHADVIYFRFPATWMLTSRCLPVCNMNTIVNHDRT